jgi:hypothetical protein
LQNTLNGEKMRKYSRKIRRDDNLRLQAADYMTYASQKVVDITIEKKDIDISAERFETLLKDYIDKSVMYEMLKSEIIKVYVPEDLLDKIDWSIEFTTEKLTITIKDDGDYSELLEKAQFIEVKNGK